MSLPLQEIATEGGLCFLITPKERPTSGPPPTSRIPSRRPRPGEQYRFHLDMTKCIGCRCCEVACNEQNNNPADIHGRLAEEREPACVHACPEGVELRITSIVAPGQVFMPFHFAETNSNLVTQSVFDPISREPNYKQCAVRVERRRTT